MREDAMRDLILAALGTGEFVSLRQLADALGRTPELLRSQHLKPLLAAGSVILKHPQNLSHPDQGYKAL